MIQAALCISATVSEATHECEYQYGEWEMATGIIFEWSDQSGKCVQRAFEKYGRQWLCPAHMDIVMGEDDEIGDVMA
jgi:hypothetical protein